MDWTLVGANIATQSRVHGSYDCLLFSLYIGGRRGIPQAGVEAKCVRHLGRWWCGTEACMYGVLVVASGLFVHILWSHAVVSHM